MNLKPDVVYADDQLLVFNKPAGLLCVPGRTPAQPDLASWAQTQFKNAFTVHRLGQATSGLVVMARNAQAQRQLSIAFAKRLVQKTYLAQVANTPTGVQGEINLPLLKDWPNRPRQTIRFLN